MNRNVHLCTFGKTFNFTRISIKVFILLHTLLLKLNPDISERVSSWESRLEKESGLEKKKLTNTIMSFVQIKYYINRTCILQSTEIRGDNVAYCGSHIHRIGLDVTV